MAGRLLLRREATVELPQSDSAESGCISDNNKQRLLVNSHRCKCNWPGRDNRPWDWGRTRFKSNGHGVHDGADGRPDFVREFDLALVRITWDRCKEDEVVINKGFQGSQVAPCDCDDTLLTVAWRIRRWTMGK